MKELIHLALKSEYSLKKTYGYVKDFPKYANGSIGIADINYTFGHVSLRSFCKGTDIKPIYGVRIMVVNDLDFRDGRKRIYGPQYIFIAKNESGLEELYGLVKDAWDNFYYMPRIDKRWLNSISDNLFVISHDPYLEYRIDFIALSFLTPTKIRAIEGVKKVAIVDNLYPTKDDVGVYELFSAGNRDSNTYPNHILSTDEWYNYFKDEEAINNTHVIADACNVTLPSAPSTKYKGFMTIDKWCERGAKEKGIDLTDPVYKERFEHEMKTIKDKDYVDYFLITADMVKFAKARMLVGPSRGSSAGSLVCYLMDITEIDPIPYGLIFARFLDPTRLDPPDIDIDFQDDKRKLVFKYLGEKYGADNVNNLANLIKFKPKSSIGAFAKELDIPAWETQAVKDAIISRSGGDARAAMCMLDTLEGTEPGKDFIAKYPAMRVLAKIENHASHTGIHAAAMIVCNDPLTKYGGINSRDGHLMLDQKTATGLDLLKIDCLGLRTLTIISEVMKSVGLTRQEIYSLPLDDEDTFEVFNSNRFSGIFQFEGQALQHVCKSTGIHSFNDVVATTALARPGALNSGGTNRYIKYKTGLEEPKYISPLHKKITEETLGIVAYQETMMQMAKEIGGLTWEDVAQLRRAASKSLGDEYFSQYREKFLKGAIELTGHTPTQAQELWTAIASTGSWTFNKSHAVSYGMLSYITAYLKAHYPLEFTIANLNHASSEDGALRLLRDAVLNEGIEYVPVNIFKSDNRWTVHDGKLLGGLVNIKGIGVSKANAIKRWRKSGEDPTPGMAKIIGSPTTNFDILFPTRYFYGDIYNNCVNYGLMNPPVEISSIEGEGTFTVIGKLVKYDLRDLNDYQGIQKRNGRILDSDPFFLKLIIEDDTDSIMCMIGRFDFDKLEGRHLSETIKDGHTWFLIKGTVKGDWRMINVTSILNLTEWEAEGNEIKRTVEEFVG